VATQRARAARAAQLLSVPEHDGTTLDRQVRFHEDILRASRERVCVMHRTDAGESSRMAV